MSPFIQRALDRGHEETNLQIVYSELLKDFKQLFLITKDNYESVGACVTEITQYPKHKSLKVDFVGGSFMNDWFELLDKTLVDFAKENGCKYLEVIGRKGWVRQLKPLDYKLSYYYLHKEV